MKKKIIITGSEGYIGSCLVYFLKKKYQIIKIDKKGKHKLNLLNKKKVINYLSKFKNIDTIIHLAGESLVDETKPFKKYFDNNVKATKNIIEIANLLKIKKIIYSSTAAVYQESNNKLTEKFKINPISKYARTKLMCEKIIENNLKTKSIIFRFFNVAGSLIKIGENHKPETHLVPNLVKAGLTNKTFYINSDQYNTKDGTCIRDYIHIKDLCIAIQKAIEKKLNYNTIFNLGSSRSYTIFEALNSLEGILKKKINFKITSKRKGDSAKLVCSNTKSFKILNWKPRFSNIKNILNSEILWQLIK